MGSYRTSQKNKNAVNCALKSYLSIMLDTKTLLTFVVLAQERNFTRVAAKRHTTQSAISAQIRKLEDRVGKTLVARGRG